MYVGSVGKVGEWMGRETALPCMGGAPVHV